MFHQILLRKDIKHNLIISLKAGHGDIIHLQPALDEILEKDLVAHIYAFIIPTGMGVIEQEMVTCYSDSNIEKYNELAVPPNTVAVIDKNIHSSGHNMHRSATYMSYLLSLFGINGGIIRTPRLHVTKEEYDFGRRVVRHDKSVLIQTTSLHRHKSIPKSLVKAIIKELIKYGYYVYLVTDDFGKYSYLRNVHQIKGLNAQQLKGICSVVNHIIAPDSFIGWLGVGVNTPTTILFGATNPENYVYDSANLFYLYNKDSECLFCESNGRQPCEDKYCMQVSAEEVVYTVINKKYKAKEIPKKQIIPARKPKLLFFLPHLLSGGIYQHVKLLLPYMKQDFDAIIATDESRHNADLVAELDAQCIIDNKITDIINIWRPDIVIVSGFCKQIYSLYSLKARPPFIFVLHNATRYSIDYIRHCWNIADAIITVNKEIKDLLTGINEDITCIYNTVLPEITASFDFREKFMIHKNNFVIGSCTRTSNYKGIFELIDAVRLLPDNFTLIIAGVEDTQWLDDRILLLSDFGDKASFYNALDVFVLPSFIEGDSLSIIEAVMYNVPLIVTPVGAAKERFVDGESAVFVNRNKYDIANAILFLQQNSDFAKKLAYNAKAKVKDYTVADMYARYKEIIDRQMEKSLQQKDGLVTQESIQVTRFGNRICYDNCSSDCFVLIGKQKVSERICLLLNSDVVDDGVNYFYLYNIIPDRANFHLLFPLFLKMYSY